MPDFYSNLVTAKICRYICFQKTTISLFWKVCIRFLIRLILRARKVSSKFYVLKKPAERINIVMRAPGVVADTAQKIVSFSLAGVSFVALTSLSFNIYMNTGKNRKRKETPHRPPQVTEEIGNRTDANDTERVEK